MPSGAMRATASFKSETAPGSYSIVVRPAVEPGVKTRTIPLPTPLAVTIRSTCGVMSRTSVNPFVSTTKPSSKTTNIPPRFRLIKNPHEKKRLSYESRFSVSRL